MKTSTRLLTMTACLACALILRPPALGGTFFYDDFEDGSAVDGNPVNWIPVPGYDSGTFEVVNGDYILTPDTPGTLGEVDADVGGQVYDDVSLRTQVRCQPGDWAVLYARSNFVNRENETSYQLQGGIRQSDGLIAIAYAYKNGATILDQFDTDWDLATQDIHLQLDIIQDQLSLTAWPEGEEKPTEPQITADTSSTTDILGNHYDDGTIGLFVYPQDGFLPPFSCKFRYFEAASVIPVIGVQAGDADQDQEFDQLDLVRVQIAAKYLTGQAATWGEGDWDGAPGGAPGNPPPGNGLFDQVDLIAALGSGVYLTGPYAAIKDGGTAGDEQTSIFYYPATGEVAVDAPAGTQLTSLNIDSAAAIFTGSAAQNLGGSFDNDADNNIFKATFGSSFASLTFGNVAQTALSKEFVLNDLTVIGSLAGGGDLGEVDLIYVPEPSAAVLAIIGLLSVVICRLGPE